MEDKPGIDQPTPSDGEANEEVEEKLVATKKFQSLCEEKFFDNNDEIGYLGENAYVEFIKETEEKKREYSIKIFFDRTLIVPYFLVYEGYDEEGSFFNYEYKFSIQDGSIAVTSYHQDDPMDKKEDLAPEGDDDEPIMDGVDETETGEIYIDEDEPITNRIDKARAEELAIFNQTEEMKKQLGIEEPDRPIKNSDVDALSTLIDKARISKVAPGLKAKAA